MRALEEKILNSGTVINNSILKVDSFLNYKINISMLKEISSFIASHFKDQNINKILTIESSGIAFAIGVSLELNNIDVIFAKKSTTSLTVNDENYFTLIHSFTHGMDCNVYVRKNFLNKNDNVLIIDDFLAAGSASVGLVNICKQAHAHIVGVGIAVEKEFQGGRKALEDLGVKVVSCARITEFKDNKPIFSKEEC